MEKSKLEKKLNTREILLIPFVPENIIIIVVVVVLVVMPIVITGSRVHRGAPSVCDNNDDDDDDDVPPSIFVAPTAISCSSFFIVHSPCRVSSPSASIQIYYTLIPIPVWSRAVVSFRSSSLHPAASRVCVCVCIHSAGSREKNTLCCGGGGGGGGVRECQMTRPKVVPECHGKVAAAQSLSLITSWSRPIMTIHAHTLFLYTDKCCADDAARRTYRWSQLLNIR
ncbi:hypothetical protein QTP88_012471 [Uroleucon formosanum]